MGGMLAPLLNMPQLKPLAALLAIGARSSNMKKLFAAFLLALLTQQYSYSYELTITLTEAGDLINQVDVSTLDQVEKLTISGDINGTDILVIRKMVNLKDLDIGNTNIVSGGVAYFEDNTTEDNIVGNYMFSGLSHLEHIITPQNIIAIYRWAFSGCVSLKEFNFTDKIKSIAVGAFNGCKSINSISIPSNITIIGDDAFYGCENLKVVTFADCTNNISLSNPFKQCPIEKLNIGRDINYNEFSGSPFRYLTSLTDVTISDNVTSLYLSFFYGCTGLETINLPNSIKEIWNAAFRECENLKTIHLPDSLTKIYPYTFYGCSSLQEITIPSSVTVIGNYAFQECSNLSSAILPDSLTGIADYAFSGCCLSSIDIPHNKTIKIGDGAFEGNSLTSIPIPNNVTSIGSLAFADCVNLKEVVLEDGEDNLNFPVVSMDDDKTCFRNCPIETVYWGRNIYGERIWNMPTLTKVTIGNTVTRIPRYAFYNCTGLKQISLPSSVTYIGENAFSQCSNLESVNIPESVTAIYYGTFIGCQSLREIILPKELSVIGGYGFHLCNSLTSVTSLNPTPPSLMSDTFDEETEKNATLYVPIGSKNLYMISPLWENFYNIVETDLSSINSVEIDKKGTIDAIYRIDGKKPLVTEKSVLPKGVYIINGRKCLIK